MAMLIEANGNNVYDLDKVLDDVGVVLIGTRSRVVPVKDPYASALHATIFRDETFLYIADHSKNGTKYRMPGEPDKRADTIDPGMKQSHREADEARMAGDVGGIKFDQSQPEVKQYTAFLEALRDPEQRKYYASLGLRLDDGVELAFGRPENRFVFRL